MSCPCGTTNTYDQCCGPLHAGEAKAQSAAELMRSRYSAFVKNQIQYIADTHVPGTKDFNLKEAQEWATKSVWKGLEIVKEQKGKAQDNMGVVEFKAHYSDDQDKDYIHHEIATFKKEGDTWYYEDGQIVGLAPLTRPTPKVGRNEPCLCGSGKKFKKCCALSA